MRCLEASHVVEIMREGGSAGLHVQDLAARVDCNPNKLGWFLVCRVLLYVANVTEKNTQGHVLRLLATHHIGKEVSPNVFANNRLSSLVDSGKDFEVIKAK
jgi:hypothetical protein